MYKLRCIKLRIRKASFSYVEFLHTWNPMFTISSIHNFCMKVLSCVPVKIINIGFLLFSNINKVRF
jgi:hypothetical protein